MNVNEIVEKAYCINLDRRDDRWGLAQEEFSKNSIVVERFSATDGSSLENFPRLTRGEAGCLLSHLDVLQHAIDNDYMTIALFEDDVYFIDDFENKFSEMIPHAPEDWQFLYFAVNKASANFSPANSYFRKVTNAYSAHAVFMKRAAMETVKAIAHAGEKQIDVYYGEIQNYLPAYVFTPSLAGQRTSYSDIIGEFVDYNWTYDLETR